MSSSFQVPGTINLNFQRWNAFRVGEDRPHFPDTFVSAALFRSQVLRCVKNIENSSMKIKLRALVYALLMSGILCETY